MTVTSYLDPGAPNDAGIETPPQWDTDSSEFDVSGTPMYVSPSGDDTNSGLSLGSAKATILAAQQTVDSHGVARAILLDDGDYRASHRQTAASSKIQYIAAVRGAAPRVLGSDLIDRSDFTHIGGQGWKSNFPYGPPIQRAAGQPYPDQVHADGNPLTQVFAPNPGAGEYYVDRSARRIFLGDDPGGMSQLEMTMRGYVLGTPGVGHAKSHFGYRGITFAHWGSDWRNDTYGALSFRGVDQFLHKCTLAYASTTALDVSSTTRMDMADVLLLDNYGLGMHANHDVSLAMARVRIGWTNWAQGFDVTPGASARIACAKLANGSGGRWTDIIAHDSHCNGWWLDVNWYDYLIGRMSAFDCFGYGATFEIGKLLRIADALMVRNGNTSFGNRDGIRVSGTNTASIENLTSIDNKGAALGVDEDSRTYDTNVNAPDAAGDTRHCIVRNHVLVNTSSATRSPRYSVCGKTGASGPGQRSQSPAFDINIMLDSDHGVIIRLDTSHAAFTDADPTSDFSDPGTGYSHQTSRTFAEEQGIGQEVGSIAIDDDGAPITDYFPNASTDDYSWSALATIPTDGRSTTGGVPDAWAADILGIPHGTHARYGCYLAPTLGGAVASGGGSGGSSGGGGTVDTGGGGGGGVGHAGGISQLTATRFRLDDLSAGADLTRAYARSWQSQLSEPGTGGLTLHNTDDDLAAFQYDGDDLVTFRYKGWDAFTMLVESADRVLIAPAEDVSEATALSGRGHLALLERGLIYPVFGPGSRPITEDRQFNWSMPFYDDGPWGLANSVGQYQHLTDWGAVGVNRLDPNWPDPLADMLWANDGTMYGARPGEIYFRDFFTIAAHGTYKLYVLMDNYGEFYMDGVLVCSPGSDSNGRDGFTAASTVDLDFSIGEHWAAAHVVNVPFIAGNTAFEDGNPAGVMWTLMPVDGEGNLGDTPIAHSAAASSVLEYPASVPGLTPGKVMRLVLEEAQARGALTYVTLDFDDFIDSGGSEWPIEADISTKVGTDLLTFFREMSGTYIDFDMIPGTTRVRAWVQGGKGVARDVFLVPPTLADPTTGNLVSLQEKREA